MDNQIYEVLYELAEDENDELRVKIKVLQAYIRELEADNKALTETFINTIRIDKRYN